MDENRIRQIVNRAVISSKLDSLKLVQKLDQVVDQKIKNSDIAKESEVLALKVAIDAIPSGEKGDKGDKGDKGEKGDPGKDGRDGKDGVDGEDGRNGVDGRDGSDGKDAELGDVIESINESEGIINKDRVEGLKDIEAKADMALSRPTVIAEGQGGASGVRSISAGDNITVSKVNEKYTISSSISTLFTQTSDVTIANTTTETNLFGTGEGSLTLPANFLKVGRTIRLIIQGYHSSAANPSFTINAKINGATVATGTGTSGNGDNDSFICEVNITCRSIGETGTVAAVGEWREVHTNGADLGLFKTGTTTLDTTIEQALTLTYTWGTASASNTVTSQVAIVEAIN